MNKEEFERVIEFINKFELNSKLEWFDNYGSTQIHLGREILNEKFLREYFWQKDSIVFKSSLTNKLLFKSSDVQDIDLDEIKYVISFGGALQHNLAKELLMKVKIKKIAYISIPCPLSNDSFCTNRSSIKFKDIRRASRESIFPSKIMIDLSLLRKINPKYNLYGIGEFIGLYYSLWDYYSIRNSIPPNNILNEIITRTRKLVKVEENGFTWLKLLAECLLAKCLVMRVAKTNAIGAGADHLLAYAFEDYSYFSKKSHGEKVFLGSIIMAGLFPEWDRDCFSLNSLINFGLKKRILNEYSLKLVLKVASMKFFKKAISTRPNRKTALSLLEKKRIRFFRNNLNEKLRSL